MNLHVYSSPLSTAKGLIHYIIDRLSGEPQKVFYIAFSGGETPMLMFDVWANEFSDITPWERIRFFWVDERCVEPQNPESNYGQMKKLLLDVVGIPEEHIFRIHGEDNPAQEAKRYSGIVKEMIPHTGNYPAFDVVLLGIGADGHTSSIFPGQEYLLSSDKLYEVSANPSSGQQRIALTGLPILKAHTVVFLVTGKSKTKVIKQLYSEGGVTPSVYIAHRAKKLELFVDKDAAADLPEEKRINIEK